MKVILLFFSLLVFCFWGVEGQIPDLPLSFTNEEVRRFKDSVEPYCLFYYEEEIKSFEKNDPLDPSISGFGQKMEVNILQKTSKISVEGGSLYIYKIESPDIQSLKINYDIFYLLDSSYMYIYNEFSEDQSYKKLITNFNDRKDYITLLTNSNNKLHFNIVEGHPLFGNRLIIELFEPHKITQSSEIVIGGIVRLR